MGLFPYNLFLAAGSLHLAPWLRKILNCFSAITVILEVHSCRKLFRLIGFPNIFCSDCISKIGLWMQTCLGLSQNWAMVKLDPRLVLLNKLNYIDFAKTHSFSLWHWHRHVSPTSLMHSVRTIEIVRRNGSSARTGIDADTSRSNFQ
jgi:hypothetical protein